MGVFTRPAPHTNLRVHPLWSSARSRFNTAPAQWEHNWRERQTRSPPNTIRALMMGQAGVTFSRVPSASTAPAPPCSAVTPRQRRTRSRGAGAASERGARRARCRPRTQAWPSLEQPPFTDTAPRPLQQPATWCAGLYFQYFKKKFQSFHGFYIICCSSDFKR